VYFLLLTSHLPGSEDAWNDEKYNHRAQRIWAELWNDQYKYTFNSI